MSEYVDEVSGITFKRKRNHNESIQPKHNDDVMSTKSCSSISTAQVTTLNKPRPSNVPTTDYLKYIPSEWSTADKLRQLLVWLGEKALEDEGPKARPSSADKLKLTMIDKLKTSTTIITLHNNPELLVGEGPNPIDIRNERILKEYRQDIKIIRDEIDQWTKCEEEAFAKHAVATDKLETARFNFKNRNEDSMDQSEDFMDHIEANQREYLDQFAFNDSDPEIAKRISKMNVEVAQLRQTMSITSYFNKQAAKLADNTKSELAYKVRENSRIVPVDADKRTLGLFEDTEAKRKENEIRNMELSLRLLSRSSRQKTSMNFDD